MRTNQEHDLPIHKQNPESVAEPKFRGCRKKLNGYGCFEYDKVRWI